MKTTIAVVACALVAFTGMSLFLASPYAAGTPAAKESPEEAPKPAPAPPVETPRPKATTVRETRPEPRPLKPAVKPSIPGAKPAKTTRSESGSKPAKKQPLPLDTYFTVEGVAKNGIPSRVIIHNTPIGKCNILLISSSSSTGELFGGSGNFTSGGKKYPWEVTVRSGNVTVMFDGKRVRRGR